MSSDILKQILIENRACQEFLLMAFMINYLRDGSHRSGIYRAMLILVQTIIHQFRSHLINDSVHNLRINKMNPVLRLGSKDSEKNE